MRTILVLAINFCITSCNKKDAYSFSAPDILMKHSWSPVKTEIVKVDSITKWTISANGNLEEESVTRTDTSFILKSCEQQTTYHFQPNGNLYIKDMCNSSQQDISSTWTITQTNMLTFPFKGNVFPRNVIMMVQGHVTKINKSEFVLNTMGKISTMKSFDGPNGSKTYEGHNITITESMTYKSR